MIVNVTQEPDIVEFRYQQGGFVTGCKTFWSLVEAEVPAVCTVFQQLFEIFVI